MGGSAYFENLKALLNGQTSAHVKLNVQPPKKRRAKPSIAVEKPKDKRAEVTIRGDITAVPVEQLLELQPLIDAYENKELVFIAEEDRQTVNDVLTFEKDSHIQGLLKFFSPKLPVIDFQMLRTGLYVGHLHSKGKYDEAANVVGNLNERYGERERRIINLASANYFSDYFRPLYKELSKVTNGDALFMKEYNSALDNMNFAVFVHHQMTTEEIVRVVKEKAVQNIRYGVRSATISLHGIGKNVELIMAALKELRNVFPDIRVKNPRKGSPVIRARIYYDDNRLTDEDFENLI